ncbi:HAD family hydrolase [Halomonas llamarensis]|uniref:HAD-IA family hydrolase n=1 Tax=Halomonas llamarensis TaxID=2945104 RepID=A0ABT0SUZ6_9GAMM|nr:HAD-IA family hydrolase [Halomonas llamarensis]MCL7931659.1 HAD-IA family hydrolase [Halomonas llamarensis]
MPIPLCLLFDSDGTLVDSEIILAEVMGELLPTFDLPFSAQQYIEEFRGVRFRTIIDKLGKHHGILGEESYSEMEREMRHLTEQRMRAELLPIDCIPEALESLVKYPKAVVSNGPERKVRCAMESTGLSKHFGDNFYSAYNLGIWKPDPGLYLKAAESMEQPPERCVVIDDAIVGVAAGLAAGMQVIHFNRFPKKEKTPEGAIVIHHASELPKTVALLAAKIECS